MKKIILVLVCNPEGTEVVRVLEESRHLERTIKRSQYRERFSVELETAVRFSDLQGHILDHKPQIIHFCGHGANEGLILHDENGTAKLVSNKALANLLKNFNDRIECVFLNACDSETLADEIVKHINYAIGMNQPVGDNAAIAFSKAFYEALGAEEFIERAFNLGKNAVEWEVSSRNSDESRKAIPVNKDGDRIEQNQEHLIPVLKTNPNPTPIKPIWLSSEVERKAVEQLLEAIQNYSKIPLFPHTIKPIIVQDQYIPVQVTLERQFQHTIETTWGYAESEAELKRAYAFKGSGEEEIKRQQVVSWQEARRQQSRIMVLADPGMGKTTLLRREVCTNIEQSYQALKDRQPLKEIVIPLFIKLWRLAKEITKMPTDEAILKIIQERHSKLLKNAENAENADVVTFLNDFLKQQLLNGKCLLLLDALDEVPHKKRFQLLEKLNDFAREYRACSIVGTSRIVGYGGKLVDRAKDMEIVPFNQQQTEQYIETWFANAQKSLNDKTTAKGLIQALRDRPQIGGLAQNPLLLSLICRLYQSDKLTLPAQRWQIYRNSVKYMLRQWSHDDLKPGQNADDANVATKIELLEELAYQFSCKETEIFPLEELREKIKVYLRRNKASDLDEKTNKFINELSKQDGILIKLDSDENPDKDQYLFLHRTFQEYFTASYLNRKIENDCKKGIEDDCNKGIKCVKQYVWNYKWHEILTLLAGLMEKPMMLIEALAFEEDDIFETQLLLAGRCIAECSEFSHPRIDEKLARIYGFWLAYPDAEFIHSVVVAITQTHTKFCQSLQTALTDVNLSLALRAAVVLGDAANDKAVDALIDELKNDRSGVGWGVEWSTAIKRQAVYALVKIGTDKAVDALIAALEDEDSEIKRSAAKALAMIGNDKAVNTLIDALKDEDLEVKWRAAYALATIGNDKGIDILISVLNDEDSYEAKMIAVYALVKIGTDKAVDALIDVLKGEDLEVKGQAANALAMIGNDKAVNTLIDALKDEDLEVKWRAANALATIGNDKGIDILIPVLDDEDSYDAKIAVAVALERIGNDKAVDALIAALEDNYLNVRTRAAIALGEIGNDKAVDALIAALDDEDSEIKRSAEYAYALGEIGNDKAVNALIAALEDEDSEIKRSAAYALAMIGNDKGVDTLIAALEDEDLGVRSAANALAMIGNAVCLEKLFQSANFNVYRPDIFLLARSLAIRFRTYPTLKILLIQR